MSDLSLIVAVSRNGVIGAGGKMPWHLPEDLKFFKRTTLGHAVIMGRKTFESIGKPLPGRGNIVVSRGIQTLDPAILRIAPSIESAVAIARETDPEPFVIGGAAIYAEAMPLVTRMYITEVHREVEGDVLFPSFNRAEWRETTRVDGYEWSWTLLERI
jgi:dihydrofolate reductase